ncbi:MAG: glycosyltransferase [Candidatus Woesebacteria bacterium]|nr:glycosyltransferase [Candidatus Woesebacteria bacterium]
MNISICIITLNEEGVVATLLDSLLHQSKKANEIIIVDGGSTDKTIEIIRHYQKKFGGIKLLIEKSTRAGGRNIGIEIAKGDIIATTDAGCIADKNWLKNLTAPFATGRVDVSAGFYRMTGNSSLQKAESIYLGTRPRKFDRKFLPSSRSLAFTKKIWEELGGFPENIEGTVEDTMFNKNLLKHSAKISRVKDATVEWGMPDDIGEFFWKVFGYARGDALTKIWFFPGKGLASHNIKSIFILSRYILGLTILILSFKYHMLLPALVFLFLLYLIWAYRKIYIEFGDWKIALWGPMLQLTSDIGVMGGFLSGLF